MLRSKLPHIGTTIFSVMSALAHQHHAVNLSQGFPDFQPDERLLRYTEEALRGNAHQYALMPGNITLRERLAEKYASLYAIDIHPDTDITITAGGAQAIFTIIQAMIHPGDEVILFAPCYDSYAPAVTLAGGICVYHELHPPHFERDWNAVKASISERTKMILINSPHNPTGTCWRDEDMRALQEIVAGTGILIISDEVYEHIVFDGVDHVSALRYPALRDRTFVVNSFGKTYHCTGWKVGYVIAPPHLTKEFRKVHQYNVFSVNSIAQAALSAILRHTELYESLPLFYQQKRDYFRQLISSTPLHLLPCEGTYFQLVDYSAIYDGSEYDCAVWLTQTLGVAAIPVSAFYPTPDTNQSLLRFCFAKHNSTLEQAAERLQSL